MTSIEIVTNEINKLVKQYKDLSMEDIVVDNETIKLNIVPSTKVKSDFKSKYLPKPLIITADPYFYFMKCKRNSSIRFEDIIVRFNINKLSLVLQDGRLDRLTFKVSDLLYGLEFLSYQLIREYDLKSNRDDKLKLREMMEDIIHNDGTEFICEMGEDLAERDYLEVSGDMAIEYAVSKYMGFINYTETSSWTSCSEEGGINSIIVSREKYDYHYPIRTRFNVFLKYGKITHMEEIR